MDRKPSPPASARQRLISRHGGVSLSVTLAVSISVLVLIAVVAVLSLGLWSGAQNTMSLLRDSARFIVGATIDDVQKHLDPARHQAVFVEQLIASGRLDPSDRQTLLATLTGALAAAPQVNAFLFVDNDYQGVGVARDNGAPQNFVEDYSSDASVLAAMKVARTSETAVWGEPVWRREPKATLLNFRLGVHRDGQFLGLLIATVTVRELSGYLGALDPEVGSNVFILYDRSHVLAHPNLEFGGPERSEEKPLRRRFSTASEPESDPTSIPAQPASAISSASSASKPSGLM